MKSKQSKIKRKMIKALKKAMLKKGQSEFVDPITGKPITTKEFVNLLLAEKHADVLEFMDKCKKKLKRKKSK